MRARVRARAVTLIAVSAIAAAPLWYQACVIADAPEQGKPCPCSDGFVCDRYTIFDGGPEGGQCVSIADHPCDAGLVYCGGHACTDLATDPANCGVCLRSCAGLSNGFNTLVGCVAGQCVAAGCGIRDRVGPDGRCYKPLPGTCDDAGCVCGEQTCPAGFTCASSSMQYGPKLGECACTKTACHDGGSCILDPGTPDASAGVCVCGADVCVPGEVCGQGGTCSCDGGGSCPKSNPPTTLFRCCSTGCVDVHDKTELDNCGACGARCPPGFFCNAASWVVDDQSSCACTDDACRASGGATARCDPDGGVCVCGDDNPDTACDRGKRCTTAAQGKAGCM
jgi:hypothetical protein